MGPRKSASNRAPHLLRPALSGRYYPCFLCLLQNGTAWTGVPTIWLLVISLNVFQDCGMLSKRANMPDMFYRRFGRAIQCWSCFTESVNKTQQKMLFAEVQKLFHKSDKNLAVSWADQLCKQKCWKNVSRNANKCIFFWKELCLVEKGVNMEVQLQTLSMNFLTYTGA